MAVLATDALPVAFGVVTRRFFLMVVITGWDDPAGTKTDLTSFISQQRRSLGWLAPMPHDLICHSQMMRSNSKRSGRFISLIFRTLDLPSVAKDTERRQISATVSRTRHPAGHRKVRATVNVIYARGDTMQLVLAQRGTNNADR